MTHRPCAPYLCLKRGCRINGFPVEILVLQLPDRDPLRLLHALQQHQHRVLLSGVPALKLLQNFTAGMQGNTHGGSFFPSSASIL